MRWYLLLMIVLSYQVNIGAGCKEEVDCGCVEDVDGVSLVDCPLPEGGSGEPKNKSLTELDCCTENVFRGPTAEHYNYGGGDATCPVFIEFLEINLDAGETVIVRNVYCQEEEGCKMMVIDEDAAAETPFTLPVSASYFSFSSSGDDVYVKFRIVNEECNECTPECEPMWHNHGDFCYYLVNHRRSWNWHNNNCKNNLESSMVQIHDQSSWDFVFDLGGHLRWVGLRCIDDNNTNWWWDDRTQGDILNDIPELWEVPYPVPSIDAHCAFFGFNQEGKVRNTNCAELYKSMCFKPLESD